MFGFKFEKAQPNTFVILSKNGKTLKSGQGLSYFYYVPTTNVVHIPVSSMELPFAFSETTNDFQKLTVNGNLVYQIKDPDALAKTMDYSVLKDGRYASDDPGKLQDRLLGVMQSGAQSFISQWDIETAMKKTSEVEAYILATLKDSSVIGMLGIEIIDLKILRLLPDKEIQRSLETTTRERMKKEADDAIYQRRNASIEQERRVKENELLTELKIEEERKKIEQTKIEAMIEAERKRSELVEKKVENDRKIAESKAYALQEIVKVVQDVDWKKVMSVNGSLDPQVLVGMAFNQLAEKAENIQNLHISPDLVEALKRA